jgi:hypothetical protein
MAAKTFFKAVGTMDVWPLKGWSVITNNEISPPKAMGRIVKPKKKLDDGKNKVFTKIKVLKHMKMTTQNKEGNRLSERSTLVSLLSATSSDFLMMSE